MITAVEKGRRLHVTIGEGDDSLNFVVPPVNTEQGSILLVHFLGIYTGTSDKPALEGVALAKVALSEDVYESAQELRPAEFDELAGAAMYWNVFGGGQEALDAFLAGGHPKASEVVLSRAGVHETRPSKTSPSSESENPTP